MKDIEKGLNYKEQITKLNKALKNEYYYEVIIINYAIMEDRLESILYHLGLLNEFRNKFNYTFKTIKEPILICNNIKKINLNTIISKLTIIKYIINNYNSDELYKLNPNYLKILKKVFLKLDINEFNKVLEDIDIWRIERNNIVHGLMKNKPSNNLSKLASDGYILSRKLDKYCSYIKRRTAK